MRESVTRSLRLDRHQRREDFWQVRKKKFFLTTTIVALLLQLLFLGNMSYLYGAVWKSSHRAHNFHVLYVDYDGGVIGNCLEQAYQMVKGSGFPTFIRRSPEQYPSLSDVVSDVKDTTYWAAFVANANASEKLVAALQGGSHAQAYEPESA